MVVVDDLPTDQHLPVQQLSYVDTDGSFLVLTFKILKKKALMRKDGQLFASCYQGKDGLYRRCEYPSYADTLPNHDRDAFERGDPGWIHCSPPLP